MGESPVLTQPVTPETWPDMVRLFESKGCPHYCWCMPYRDSRSQDLDKPGKKAAMEALIAAGTIAWVRSPPGSR